MRLEDFRYISEIIKRGSFSKAAKSLYISQPALSKAVLKLETELGVTLIERDKNALRLTSAGELFLAEAQKVLEITDHLVQQMHALSPDKNATLRVGASQFYIKYFFPRVIPYFNQLYPNIHIKITEEVSNLTEKYLLDGDLDVSIVPLPVHSPKLSYTHIFEETFQFAFSSLREDYQQLYSEGMSHGRFDLSYFKREPFILLKQGFKMRTLSESIFNCYDFQPDVALETENYDTINSLISHQYGVSILPSFITKYDNVSYVPLDCEFANRQIVAAYAKSNSDNKFIKAFIRCLQEVLKDSLDT